MSSSSGSSSHKHHHHHESSKHKNKDAEFDAHVKRVFQRFDRDKSVS